MTEIVDLNAERKKREQPDAEHVRKDEFGRSLYRFLYEYEFEGGEWMFDLWAYSQEEAERRVTAIRESVTLAGQIQSSGSI